MSVITAVESDVLSVVGDRVRILVDSETSSGTFELFELQGDLGSGPPPHAHPWLEAYFILDGQVLVELDGESCLAEPGTSVVVPAGHVHRFEIASDTARFVVATSGGRASVFFRDLSQNAPGAPTPENLPGIVEVAKRNGLTSPIFE
jgi:quercetin dioxygenase-like cupin family protein